MAKAPWPIPGCIPGRSSGRNSQVFPCPGHVGVPDRWDTCHNPYQCSHCCHWQPLETDQLLDLLPPPLHPLYHHCPNLKQGHMLRFYINTPVFPETDVIKLKL